MVKNGDIKAIIFDIDDTLFDRKKAIGEVIRGVIKKLPELFYGIKEEKMIEAFRKADRKGLDAFNKGVKGLDVRNNRSKWFLEELELDTGFSDRITELYIEAYPSVSASVKNAKQVVEKLSKEFSLGVISNGFPDIQYNKLKALQMEELFQVILLSEEIGIRKPDEGIFRKAAELLNRKAQDCLFVGDSIDTDILGAKRSGMKACWFNRDGKDPIQEEVKPDFEIHSLSELLLLSF